MPRWKNNRNYLHRGTGSKGRPKPTILIVCEGERTEPLYFEGFKVSSATVIGTGRNTDNLVEYAIERKGLAEPDSYDQVWCVFDRDSCPSQNFNRALQMADANGIKVAYSNEAFELWYLLHFDFHTAGISRQDYIKKLSAKLGFPYAKSNSEMYSVLLDKQVQAIKFATNLLNTYSPLDPCNDNPSTTVHHLVEELNKYKL